MRPRIKVTKKDGESPARRSTGSSQGRDRFEKKDRYGAKGKSDKPFGRGERSEKKGERFEKKDRFDKKDRFEKRERFDKKERSERGTRGGSSFANRAPKKNQPKEVVPSDGSIRLNKFIANSGICSRRDADEYIQAGLVSVNGVIVTEMGVKVTFDDDVRFNGERIKGEKKVYIVMNKPKDFVTTMSDPHAERNVMELISKAMCPERVYPIGRLDKSTTGVLLFTNDGELAERLTHPSYQKKKIYQVTLDRNFKGSDMTKLTTGIDLEDGKAYADEATYVGESKDQVGLEIHSGKNRIVRRMFEALGYKVKKLDRVYFAGLTKKNLSRGQWRFLSDEEVIMLKMNMYE